MSILSKLFGSTSESDTKPIGILEFNYFYAFEYIPNIIQKYNQGQCAITKVFDIPQIIEDHPGYALYAKKVEYGIADSKKYPHIKLFAISIPNNGGLSQAYSAIIVVNEKKKHAHYFTMEISFDNEFALVSPTVGNRANFGFVSSPQEFTERALEIALGDNASTTSSANKKSTSNTSDRIDSIEMLLEAGIEWFQQDFFPLSDVGKAECALLIASMFRGYIKDDDIANAIYSNPDWSNTIDASFISSRISNYIHEYDKRVATLDSPERFRLIDFAQKFGRMKISTIQRKDGSDYKIALFIDAKDKITTVKTDSLNQQEVEPKYISEHRNDYGVRLTPNSVYELFIYSKEEAANLTFFALIANFLLLTPLQNTAIFGENDKVNSLWKAGYDVNVLLDKAMSAFKSTQHKVWILGHELGLLPESMRNIYDDLP